MAYSILVTTEELAAHQGDPDWMIVDCRFDLSKPEWGLDEYQKGHIRGAVYASLDTDLAGPITSTTGRHPLPDPTTFIQTLSAWGIQAGKQVVAYDQLGGAYAVRLWWLLRLFGHTASAVLDGGFPKWEAEGRPLTSGMEHNPPADFAGQIHPEMMVDAEMVERIRLDPAWKLVDARSPQRFSGEQETIDPVAGHIPGAVNRFHAKNLTPAGVLKPATRLRAEFDELLQGTDPEHTVLYCGSGITSIHHLLAMEQAGLKGAKIYVGSWSEWIRDPNRAR